MTPDDALRWKRIDAYHVRSECGRYSIARIDVGTAHVYEAWASRPERWAVIGSFRVPPDSDDARRLVAINAMKQRCAEDAGLVHVEQGQAA